MNRGIQQSRVSQSTKIKGIVLTIAFYFFNCLIKPNSITEDNRRKELLLNIILLSLIILSAIGCILILHAEVNEGINYGGVNLLTILLISLGFSFLLYLSRNGFLRIPSLLLLLILFLFSTYAGYLWGVDLPSTLLSYTLLIMIASVLIDTRFAFITSLLVILIIILLSYFEIHHLYIPDRSWHMMNFKIDDAIEYSIIILIIMSISWLSNRETESSLRRARRSEKDLQEERNNLELKVNERTFELQQIQIEKTTEMYRFVEFGRLASGLFHDLMSPLTAISIAIEGLKTGREQSVEHLRNHTNIALQSSHRMSELLSHAKKQVQLPGQKFYFNVWDELQATINFLSSKWKNSGINININCDKRILLYGNTVTFSHIITNLISNAIDAYEGIVRSQSKVISITIDKNKHGIILTVKDYGCGISEENISIIFEPFFSTKGHTKGMGIGLSATKHVLEKYFNGKISVQSEKGMGSVFKVFFPQQ